MSKIKLFLYDFITNQKIKRYTILILLLFISAFYYHKNNPEWILKTTVMSNIGLSIAFMTTMYSIFSYSTVDRIKAYLMLPCKKSEVFFSFVFAQYFSLLMERMSFVIIAIIFFTKEPILISLYILLGSLITVILDIVFMMSLNKKKYFIMVLSIFFIVGIYILFTYSYNHIFNLSLLMIFLFISVVLIMSFEPKHLSINKVKKSKNTFFNRTNYFFIVLAREKIVLVNTISIFIIAGIFAFIANKNPFLLNILWGIITVNTPATTMFSSDKSLMRHEKMLPRNSYLMNGLYGSFLWIYFLIANTYIILLFALLDQLNIFVILTGIVLIFIDTIIALFLEHRFPILSWQKKQEVWRNPRKYILPLIIFFITFIPYLLNAFKYLN